MLECVVDVQDFSVYWVKSRMAETAGVSDKSEGKYLKTLN